MVKIKCKIDCQVVDCQDCVEVKKEAEYMIQEVKDGISATDDKEVLFDDFQSMMFLHKHCDEFISLFKIRLRELGVIITEDGNNG